MPPSRAPHLDAAAVEHLLSWGGVIDALEGGHEAGDAQVDDTLLRRDDDALLSRAAWIDGLGAAVKTATVFPHNPGDDAGGPSTINGSVALFSDRTGVLECTLDFHLVTRWKTAGDSALAARRLARSDSGHIAIVGSGTVAASMIDAYRSIVPNASFAVWSRTAEHARRLAGATTSDHSAVDAADDLETAVRGADIVCTATMTTEPLVSGRWLHAGQHLDLIGGYRPDMREADDDCIRRASVFVDSLDTARDVGDIATPLENGTLAPSDIVDFRDLASGAFTRRDAEQITLFKNAGGAHLDLMVARHIFERFRAAS